MNLAVKTFMLSACITVSSIEAGATPEQIKKQLEQEGYQFIQQIPAPAQMVGWVGHQEQNASTVFIAKDGQYYIKGDLYNAKGDNLSIDAMNIHAKRVVLEDVWNSLATATWIQDGQKDASRIVYVFSDPNCPYCYQFWQRARPWVNAGKVQLRHIQVGIIREESRGQVATLLMSKNPEAVFADINQNRGKKRLKHTDHIPADILKKIEFNQGLMGKYGFFSTPSIVWKNQQGEVKSAQGLSTKPQEIFEK